VKDTHICVRKKYFKVLGQFNIFWCPVIDILHRGPSYLSSTCRTWPKGR